MVDLLQWWYFRGWGVVGKDLKNTLIDTVDLFSIGQLLRTLFKPFKQISTGAEGDAVDAKIAAFFDRLVSRVVGFVVRTGIILAGVVVIVLEVIFSGLMVIIWPLVPFLPIVGIVLTIAGVSF